MYGFGWATQPTWRRRSQTAGDGKGRWDSYVTAVVANALLLSAAAEVKPSSSPVASLGALPKQTRC